MIQWDDKYCTGIDKVDEHHKKLFEMLNAFENDIKQGAGEKACRATLIFLSGYVKNHFGFEEKCMTEYNCPVAGKNFAAHQEFLETFKSFEERLGKEGFTWNLLRELHAAAEEWLVNHICKIDIHLKSCAAVAA